MFVNKPMLNQNASTSSVSKARNISASRIPSIKAKMKNRYFMMTSIFSNFEKPGITRGQKMECLLFHKKSPFWGKWAIWAPLG